MGLLGRFLRLEQGLRLYFRETGALAGTLWRFLPERQPASQIAESGHGSQSIDSYSSIDGAVDSEISTGGKPVASRS